MAADVAQKNKEPTAGILKSLFETVPPALGGLLKLYPDKYAKQKRASWRSEVELVWNLVLAAGKAFDTEAEATEDEAVASEPSEDEGEAALEQHLTDIFGEE